MATLVHREPDPVWEPSGDTALPWRVRTTQYEALMADWLDATVVNSTAVLWRFTHRSGAITTYAPEAVAYTDHAGHLDPLMALAHVPAQVAGDTITFDHPGYAVRYQALHDRLKLTITLKVPLRAPDALLVDPTTAILTLTGGIVLPAGLEVWDRTGLRVGDFGTMGEVFLRLPGLPDQPGELVQYLDRVTAQDAQGNRGAGELRLVTDLDGTRRLYQGMPWGWMQVAVLPVDIDPTVVATSANAAPTAYPNQRKEARFANGVLFGMDYDGTNMVCKYSTDGGLNWTAPAAGVTIASYPNGSVFIDPNDYIHVAVGNGTNVLYYRGTPDAARTSYTWSAANTVDVNNANTPDVIAHAEGTGWQVHVVYSGVNASSNETRYCPITIASDGTITVGASTRIGGLYGQAAHTCPAISIDASKNLYATWETHTTGAGYGVRAKKAAYSAGAWTWGTEEIITEAVYANQMGPNHLDSLGRLYVAFRDSSASLYLRVFQRSAAGVWTDVSPATQAGTNPTLTVNVQNDKAYLVYGNAGLKYRVYDGVTPWVAEATLDATTSADYPSARRDAKDGYALDVFYMTGTAAPYNVMFSRTVLNAPPNAPTITVPSPAVFHAATGVTIGIAHNDPNADAMSGYYLRRVYGSTTEWYTGTAWQTTKPAAPIAATGTSVSVTITAGWVSGTVYQIYAATVDSGGLEGAYNAVGVQLKASTKPTYTQTAPVAAGTVNTAKTRVQGSMSCASGVTPASYTVRQYAADGTTVLSGPTTVNSTGSLNYEIQYTQANATTYQTGVIPVDSDGLQGDEVKTSFSTSFTPPLAASNLSAVADNVNAANVLTWARGRYQTAGFTRATVAYNPETGAQAASGVPRYVNGRGANLLTTNQANGGEDGTTTGFFTNQCTIASDATKAREGTRSIKVTASITGAGAGPYIANLPVIGGMTYSASVWGLNGSSAGRAPWCRIEWYDVAGAQITAGTGTATTLNNAWQRLSYTGAAPANAVKATFAIYASNTGAVGDYWFLDGFKFEQGTLTDWCLPGAWQGQFIEEGTTNLLAANASSFETDTTGAVAQGAATLTRVTTEYKFGAASLQVTTAGTTASEGFYVEVTGGLIGQQFTGSVYLKGAGTVLVDLFRDALTNLQRKTVTLNSQWQQISVSGPLDADGAVRLYIRTDVAQAVTFYADALQIERKAYATSWTLGGTTRNAESSTLPTTDLTPQQGCIRMWVYVNAMARRQVAGQWNRVFQIRSASGAAPQYGLTVWHEPAGANWTLVTGNGTTNTFASAPDSYTPDGWHHFAVRWNSAEASLWIDGVKRATIATPILPATFASVMYLGNDNGANCLNTYFDEVWTTVDYPSDAQLLAEYQATAPPTWTASTTALAHFDGTLDCGNQNSTFGGSWRVERSLAGAGAYTALTTLSNPASGTTASYTDYIPASGQTYDYRVVAIGSNGTETVVAPVQSGITRDMWAFVPRDNPTNQLLFAHERQAGWQHDRAFQEIETRGPATLHAWGGKRRLVVNITATYVDSTDSLIRTGYGLTKEQWRQRFIDLVGVQGYLCSPDGLVARGILEPPSGQFVRDMIVNPVTIQCRWVEKGAVP